MLTLVGLETRLDHLPSQLSAGEQQRVAVARAIVKSPDILLYHEPTGARTTKLARSCLRAIACANERLGTTTIIITPNAAIAGMANRVLRLGGGCKPGKPDASETDAFSCLIWLKFCKKQEL